MRKLYVALMALLPFQIWAQCNGLCDYFKIEPIQFEPSLDTHYILRFEDNFDGKQIDKDVWKLIPWKQGASEGGIEKQVNTLDPENLEVSDGTLKIRLQRGEKKKRQVDWEPANKIMDDSVVNFRTYEFSSSNIWTINDDFGTGKYEIKFRVDALEGMWPAFWIYSGDGATPGGTKWNELDFFEIYYKKKKWNFTTNVHYDYENDGSTKNNQCPSSKKMTDLNEWHTCTVYFTDYSIKIYLDDNLIEKKYKYKARFCAPIKDENADKRKARKELFGWPRESGHLILNMALENLDQGISDKPEDYPCTFEVDYVKYWVLKKK